MDVANTQLLDAGIIEGSLEKSNFRQYGQMKSRAGKRQREEKD